MQVVADEPAGEGDEGIGNDAVGKGDAKTQPESHQQNSLQEGPDKPPDDEDEEEFSDG